MGAIFGSKTKPRKYVRKKQVEEKTYFDQLTNTQRPMVFWLDELLNNPDTIRQLHSHHIHLLEIRAGISPFHKDKKINQWIKDKIRNIVLIHKVNKFNAEV